ncbi:hypothetical protein D6C81_02096 [Aureobasidium pullulans]|nr:hypothetical protein D6C81_02096 [Aureobasidium pullulans]
MSKQSSQRLPAPSLFVGPPSHNASSASLTRANTDTSQTSKPAVPSSQIPGPASPSLNQGNLSRTNTNLSRQGTRDQLSRQNTRDQLSRSNTNLSVRGGGGNGGETAQNNQQEEGTTGPVGLSNTTISEEVKRQRPRRGTAVLDAHWAALQSTLSDIELSAGSSAHVFGEGHAKALEELRQAQVELARAWGQTDAADTDITETKDKRNSKESKKEKDNTDGKSNPPQNKHDKNEKEMSEQAQRKLSTTTLDLTSAAKRRETSDKYFAAVKSGVAEVVRKLDGVADAMREVEMQSRDIWGDGDGKGSDGSSGFGSLSS